jgi:4-amino-4-deoxy-L-arabinose transferase-like glycosyltransferase
MTSVEAPPPARGPRFWRDPILLGALLVALAVRSTVAVVADLTPRNGLENGYLRDMATLASGYGPRMVTPEAYAAAGVSSFNAIDALKTRQAEGGRIDAEHPWPASPQGWVPATMHPAGYSLLEYACYRLGNYTGLVAAVRWTIVLLDTLACLLVFTFARNVLGRRVGLVAAWVYAILPPAIIQGQSFMPDAFSLFLISLILAAASYSRSGRRWALPAAGAAVGLACHFRPEFMLLPIVLFLAHWIDKRRLLKSLAGLAAMEAAFLILWLPWLIWTYHATGRPLLTPTTAGASMYEALGEVPGNPWNILMDDGWVTEDATHRGFPSPWGPQADRFYRAETWKCIREHPSAYLKLVAFYRLPMALVPPYTPPRQESGAAFGFSKLRKEENLSRWQVLWKYPGKVLQNMWLELLMALLSLALLLSMPAAAICHRRQWRLLAWILLPWAYVVASIVLVKQVEPRNVATVLVVQTVALAAVIVHRLDRRKKTGPVSAAGAETPA